MSYTEADYARIAPGGETYGTWVRLSTGEDAIIERVFEYEGAWWADVTSIGLDLGDVRLDAVTTLDKPISRADARTMRQAAIVVRMEAASR